MQKAIVYGCVVGVEEVEDDEDELRCLVWFNGPGDDNTQIQITVPAGTFTVRDKLVVTIEKAPSQAVSVPCSVSVDSPA